MRKDYFTLFTSQHSFFFMLIWISDLYHFPSSWRIPLNISCRTGMVETGSFNFCLGKFIILYFWGEILLEEFSILYLKHFNTLNNFTPLFSCLYSFWQEICYTYLFFFLLLLLPLRLLFSFSFSSSSSSFFSSSFLMDKVFSPTLFFFFSRFSLHLWVFFLYRISFSLLEGCSTASSRISVAC